jgi:hypothetical protein
MSTKPRHLPKIRDYILGVPDGKVNILAGHSVGHKKKVKLTM